MSRDYPAKSLKRGKLDTAAKQAASAESSRIFQRRRAGPRSGHPWTTREDDIVREVYPDYKELKRLLKQRSTEAIVRRANDLGVARKLPPWTCAEVRILRAANRRVRTTAELCALLPHRSKRAVVQKFRRLNFYLRKSLKTTGNPLIDRVRDRALDRNYSLQELDELCGRREFWSHPDRRLAWWRVAKVLPHLEMSLVLEIEDSDQVRRIRLC